MRGYYQGATKTALLSNNWHIGSGWLPPSNGYYAMCNVCILTMKCGCGYYTYVLVFVFVIVMVFSLPSRPTINEYVSKLKMRRECHHSLSRQCETQTITVSPKCCHPYTVQTMGSESHNVWIESEVTPQSSWTQRYCIIQSAKRNKEW